MDDRNNYEQNYMTRKKFLTEFLDDTVVEIEKGLFLWKNIYYEVLPYSTTLKRHNWSGFVRYRDIYMFREASMIVIKKWYPKTWKRIQQGKLACLRPTFCHGMSGTKVLYLDK